MVRLGTAVVVVLLFSCNGKKNAADVMEMVKQATVFVRTGNAAGSSFVVRDEGDDQYLLTNQHVVAGVPVGGPVQVTYFPGTGRESVGKATVVVTDSFRDLALLRAPAPAKRPTPLSGSTEARELTPVIVAGFPFGDRLSLDDKAPAASLSRASISALRTGALGELELLQLDNHINPGNSGGPVVNEQGAVVGVSVAAVRGAGIGFVIPWAHAIALLEGRGFEPHINVPPCAASCSAQVQVSIADPFRKTKRVELRLVEADDQFLQGRREGKPRAEGVLLASADRPPSGALTIAAAAPVEKGKRYFLQLGFESDAMVYGAPFELLPLETEKAPPRPEVAYRPPPPEPAPVAEPPPQAEPREALPIRVGEATYGGNCRAPRGNVTAAVQAACGGRASCDYVVDYKKLGDPVPNCAKDFRVAWACGSGEPNRLQTLPPEAGFRSVVRLSCP